MADEIAIPESIARRLAEAAAESVSDELESGHHFNAESLGKASAKLTRACNNGEDGELVAVDCRSVQRAASFSEPDIEAGRKARAFLENSNVW
jgi:hypothetical protein